MSRARLTDAVADGKIDFADLNPWAISYWSGVSGYANGMTYYKVKFDIGPTADHYVFSMPQVDGKIDFEDLILFSISYGLSANHQLPKQAVEQAEPVTVAIGDVKAGGGETRVPVMLEGAVNDLRGIVAVVQRYVMAGCWASRRAQLLSGYETPVPVMSCERDGKVYVDLAIAGAKIEALKTAGEVLVSAVRRKGIAERHVRRRTHEHQHRACDEAPCTRCRVSCRPSSRCSRTIRTRSIRPRRSAMHCRR